MTNRQNDITKLKIKKVALKEELNQLKAKLKIQIVKTLENKTANNDCNW